MKKQLLFVVAMFFALASASAAVFTVTSTADPGDGACTAATTGDGCTLREAIAAANVNPELDNIRFAAGVQGTIQLTAALPTIATNMAIQGPGARRLTVRRDTGGDYRIFTVSNGTSSGPSFTVSRLALTNGNATGSGAPGGAILNDHGLLFVIECAIHGNNATNGAGIMNDGSVAGVATLFLTKCTLSGNTAQFGGAIFNSGANGGKGQISVVNCTIADNSAGSRGAALHQTGVSGDAAVSLSNCTLSNNAASLGGIFNTGTSGSSTVSVGSCLFRTGTIGPNFSNTAGTISSLGFNLSNDGAGDDPSTGANESFLQQTGDMINTDPLLDPAGLASNGGGTDTIAVQAGSLAIDHGGTGNNDDQRSYARIGTRDIGAYEFGATLPVTLANISTRLRVETGDNVLIGGFIVTGTHSKKVIVRAIGPSLSFAGKLANPTLELFGPSGLTQSGLIDSNDNWVDSPKKQEIIDSGVAPGDNLESAIVATLPGNGAGYTAVVRGVNGGTGIGVVEAFDLDRTTDSRLANISTRGSVQTDDNVLIAGTIVLGTSNQIVVVRGIGPSLPIAGTLQNPTLELHDQNGDLIETNDNWVDSANKQAIIDSGLAPSDDQESAIFRQLPPANYTAILRGVNNTTGIAVVEVYALD